MKIKTFGSYEQRAYDQLERCGIIGKADFGVLCADNHVGYSQPIGGAIAYEHFISPSGVGYDIACGNKATKTNIKAKDINTKTVMDEVMRVISFGVGRKNNETVDHPVLEEIANTAFTPQQALLKLAQEQLGTVGSGNHYVDLFEDEDGWLWIGVHFGSRGFGHRTCTGFLALAQGLTFEDKAHEGEMDAPPTLLDTRTDLGQAYLQAMETAGNYAYAGRDWVVGRVLKILGAAEVESIHNHHNFAWKENHFGKDYWVIRKGCTPAFPGQKGFVGANMADNSVILEGIDSNASKESLYSTVHGAGRIMSRRQAAGKFKGWGKHKRQVERGLVNFERVKEQVADAGIDLRGAGADEAPEVYKKLETVLKHHEGTVKILHQLKPIAVAMAGSEEYDPYKD